MQTDISTQQTLTFLKTLPLHRLDDLASRLNLIQRGLECFARGRGNYSELPSLTDSEISEFKRVTATRKSNIHSSDWIVTFRISLDSLNSSEEGNLPHFFDSAFVFDSFGCELSDPDALKFYSRVPQEYLRENYIYRLPLDDALRHDFIFTLQSFWSSYLHQKQLVWPVIQGPNPTGRKCIVFFADDSDSVTLNHGERIKFKWSHTRHLMQYMQDFINEGYSAVMFLRGINRYYHILSPLGDIEILNEYTDHICVENNFDVHGLVSIFPEDLLVHGRDHHILTWVQPAVHWLESPHSFPHDYLTIIQALAPRVDVVVSQNGRMLELTRSLMYLGGCRLPDRFFIEAPLTFTLGAPNPEGRTATRRRYGFSNDIKAIVNGGGAWDWTATYEFLKDFCDYCERNPHTRIRFVQMGIRQNSNLDHESNTFKILDLIAKKPFLTAKGYLTVEEWDDASSILPQALCGFDYGFSVSKLSVEAFQAHRVRLTEYLQYNIPALINDFDALKPILAESCITVDVNQGFTHVLQMIESETKSIYNERVAKVRSAKLLFNTRLPSNRLVEAVQFARIDSEGIRTKRNQRSETQCCVEKRLIDLAHHNVYRIAPQLQAPPLPSAPSSVPKTAGRRLIRSFLDAVHRLGLLKGKYPGFILRFYKSL